MVLNFGYWLPGYWLIKVAILYIGRLSVNPRKNHQGSSFYTADLREGQKNINDQINLTALVESGAIMESRKAATSN